MTTIFQDVYDDYIVDMVFYFGFFIFLSFLTIRCSLTRLRSPIHSFPLSFSFSFVFPADFSFGFLLFSFFCASPFFMIPTTLHHLPPRLPSLSLSKIPQKNKAKNNCLLSNDIYLPCNFTSLFSNQPVPSISFTRPNQNRPLRQEHRRAGNQQWRILF